MTRIGVVGVGHMGWLHARNLAAMQGLSLSGVLDVDPVRAERAASEFDTTACASLDVLADRSDALVIAVPTTLHHEIATAALERDLHVFVEKPITATAETARALSARAREADRVLAVGHVERFNPAFRQLADEVRRPLFVEAHRLSPFVPRAIDVDVILDLMIHDIDLTLAVAGEGVVAEEVHAAGVPVITAREDIANARVEFSGGLVCNLTASRVSMERMRRVRFFTADRAYVAIDLFRRRGEVMRLAADPAEWLARGEFPPAASMISHRRIGPHPDANPLADELSNFVRAIGGDEAPAVDGVAATSALALALEVRASVARQLAKVQGHPA